MVDRNASDILLEVEKSIKNIEKTLKLQEFQQKLIIDNFNKFFKQIEKTQTIESKKIIEKSAPIEKEDIKNETLIEKKNRLMTVQSNAPAKLPDMPTPNTDFNFKVNRQNSTLNPQENKNINKPASKDDNERKVPVTQKLILFDGNPMVSAKVTIKNDKDEIIKMAETSPSGRWQTALSPGKYSINVCGKHAGSMLEFNQSFEVPMISSPLELPAPQAYKRKSK